MDYRLTVSYRGAAYAGWQRQENALGVQQVLEEALSDLLGEPLRVMAAGRTDAGVHARGQVVSLRTRGRWPVSALVHGVNQRLPEDVRVLAARAMPAGFDARRHALGKEYRYTLHRAEVLSPLDAPFALRVAADLDVVAMRQASRCLPGRHDFTAFARSGGSHDDPHREIFGVGWILNGPVVVFSIAGEGFLRGMVRALVGTLLEVGRGSRSAESLAALLSGSPRSTAGPTAPAHALVLERVWYPQAWEGHEEGS